MSRCPYYPEVQVDLTCAMGMDLRNVVLGKVDCTLEGMRFCPVVDWTCNDCPEEEKKTCEFAYDPYCTDGECLAMK